MKDLQDYSDEELMKIAGINPAKVSTYKTSSPAADYSGYSDEELMQIAGVNPQKVKGFFEKQRERGAEMANIDFAAQQGKITKPEAQFNKVGQFAGGVNEAIGQGISSTYNTLMTDEGKQRVNQDLQKLSQTEAGQMGLQALQKGGEIWNTYKQANPRTANILESTANIGGAVMGLGGIAKGGAMLADAAPEISAIRRTAKEPKTGQLPTPKEMKDISTQSYNDSVVQGASLPTDFMGKFTGDIKSVSPQSKIGAALQGETAATKIGNALDPFKDEQLDMPKIDEIDKILTRKANESWKDGMPSPDTKDILEIQNKFRNAVDEAEPQAGLESWKLAKSAFAASKRLQDIEDIFEHAKLMPNEANAIQAGFRNLLENESRIRGYSPQARKYIEQAAKNQLSVDLLKTMGSRLLPIIVGGAGGGLGATAATAIGGAASRGLGAAVKVRQGNKVAREVIKDFNAKNIGKLPPREAQKILAGKK